jgi:hypothetical protein
VRYVYGINGEVAATIDSTGRVTLGGEPGPAIGLVRNDTTVYGDEAGAERLGAVDAENRIRDAQHQVVGWVDASGRIIDSTSRTVGHAELPIDGAVLLLLIAPRNPAAVELAPPPEVSSTMMDDALALAEDHAMPGVRKHYRKLTDDEVYGKPAASKPKRP